MIRHILLLSCALSAVAAAQVDPKKVHRFDRQEFNVSDFDASGYILDIGGGGEGVIGRMKPQQVVAIDLYKSELLEAPPGPLKIVMDATDLKFLDASFDTATAFFSLMYMKPDVQEKAFAETYRVLRPGGRFLIWEASIPTSLDPNTTIVAFPFLFRLPKETVQTGYGTRWPDRPLDIAHYRALAEKTGFVVGPVKEQGRAFSMELRKPAK